MLLFSFLSHSLSYFSSFPLFHIKVSFPCPLRLTMKLHPYSHSFFLLFPSLFLVLLSHSIIPPNALFSLFRFLVAVPFLPFLLSPSHTFYYYLFPFSSLSSLTCFFLFFFSLSIFVSFLHFPQPQFFLLLRSLALPLLFFLPLCDFPL